MYISVYNHRTVHVCIYNTHKASIVCIQDMYSKLIRQISQATYKSITIDS